MGNSIKKAKSVFADEVASMKSLEVFGVDKCGVTWESLIRKHLAFDVLSCGVSSCNDKACLEREINKDCGC